MKELKLIKYIKNIPKYKIKLNNFSIKILNNLKLELKEIYNKNLNNNDYKINIIKNNIVKGLLFNDIPIEIRNIIENEKDNINVIIYEWNKLFKNVNYNIKLNINYCNKINNNNMKYVKEDKLIEFYILCKTIIDFLINHREITFKNHNINIFLYLTKHIKLVPNNDKEDVIIDYINVNTGITTFCREKTEINIFRSEEWFKTLIHESIHNLCIDFGNSNENYKEILKDIFIIKSDYLLFEVYTETWAEIIQILFLSLFDNFDINHRLIYEFIFSVFQCNKILSLCTNKKATYNDLINKNKNVLKYYKENSNCFCYYVLKMVSLFNINKFISLFHKNNNDILQFNKNNNNNILNFIDFLKSNYNNHNLIDYINKINTINNYINKQKNTFLNQTLRISIFEIII